MTRTQKETRAIMRVRFHTRIDCARPTMLGAVAEMELSLIRERIKNGLRKHGAGKPGPKIGKSGPSRTTLWRRQQQQAAK
jgi:DNA invertase Pin-like site-specific DNA recombinase